MFGRSSFSLAQVLVRIIEYECLELSFAISKTIKKRRYSYYGDPMRTSFEMGRKKRTPISLTNAVLYLKLR